MSQHPSLRSSEKNKQHRSVLKRYERIKTLKEKELWKDEDSVYGLPKVKIVRFKIKKEKAKAAETVEGAAAAPAEPAAPGAKAAQPKEAAKAPETQAKKESKK